MSRDFRPLFFPKWTGNKGFANFFVFAKIQSQSSKIACPRSQRLCVHTNFSLDTDVLIFLNYCYWMYKHTHCHPSTFFHLIVTLKSVRSLQSFPKVSAWSCPCPGSRWLRQHPVRIANDYFSMYPHSQQRQQHGVSAVNDYADTQFSKI